MPGDPSIRTSPGDVQDEQREAPCAHPASLSRSGCGSASSAADEAADAALMPPPRALVRNAGAGAMAQLTVPVRDRAAPSETEAEARQCMPPPPPHAPASGARSSAAAAATPEEATKEGTDDSEVQGARPAGESRSAAGAEEEGALPPGWKTVPSASRPGSNSYFHEPTGVKQSKRPHQEPSEEAVAAFQEAVAKAKRKVGL